MLRHVSQIDFKPPARCVSQVGNAFEFYVDGRMVYDFEPLDAKDALRWIHHLAGKSWATKEHLRQFARLSATHFGARHR